MNARPEPADGPVLQLAEIDIEPDDREVGVEAGADVDGAVEDAHGCTELLGTTEFRLGVQLPARARALRLAAISGAAAATRV